MLALFRTNQISASILLIFYLGVLHLSSFIFPTEWTPSAPGIGALWIYQLIGSSGFIAQALTIFLLFAQAVMVNYIVIEYRLSREPNLFAGVFFVIFASFFPEFLHLSPQHLANTIYLFAIIEMMAVYKKVSCADRIFNIGFWIAVSSLFYFSFLFFIFQGFIALSILRAFRIKERLMLLLGLATPYILLFSGYFFFDGIPYLIKTHFFNAVDFLAFLDINWLKVLFPLSIFGFIIIFLLFSFPAYQAKKNIQAQKNINLLYWGLFISAFTLLFQNHLSIEHLIVLIIPIGILLSFSFEVMSSRMAEILHLLLLVFVLGYQFRDLFIPV